MSKAVLIEHLRSLQQSSKTYTNTQLVTFNEGVVSALEEMATQISSLSETVSNKADKIASPTAGHFVAVDASGNITDSGYSTMTPAEGEAMFNQIFSNS